MNLLERIQRIFQDKNEDVKTELIEYFKEKYGYRVGLNVEDSNAEVLILDLNTNEDNKNTLEGLSKTRELVINFSNDEFKLKNCISGKYGSTSITIGGKLIAYQEPKHKPEVLCILSSHNEADILRQSVEHIIHEGCSVHVIDDWSIDGTDTILSELKNSYPSKFSFEKYPEDKPNNKYEWRELLQRKENLANSDDKYDWYIHYDADELRTSPWESVSLQSAIGYVDSLGFNAIDLTVVDYRPTVDGFSAEDDPSEFFSYFELGSRPGHFLQIKGWKRFDGVDVNISDEGGHSAQFKGRRVFPIKFLLDHYSFRSNKQGNFKVHEDRLKRIPEKERDWNIQYEKMKDKVDYIYDKTALYSNKNFKSDFILQRLFGVGIKKE